MALGVPEMNTSSETRLNSKLPTRWRWMTLAPSRRLERWRITGSCCQFRAAACLVRPAHRATELFRAAQRMLRCHADFGTDGAGGAAGPRPRLAGPRRAGRGAQPVLRALDGAARARQIGRASCR